MIEGLPWTVAKRRATSNWRLVLHLILLSCLPLFDFKGYFTFQAFHFYLSTKGFHFISKREKIMGLIVPKTFSFTVERLAPYGLYNFSTFGTF